MLVAINGSGVMASNVKQILHQKGITSWTNGKNGDYERLRNCLLKHKIDVIIDFSHPSMLEELCMGIKKYNLPAIIATTGFTDTQLKKIQDLANYAPICQTYNTGIGINIVEKLVKQMNNLIEMETDIEILETHHNKKVDAPSGTAIKLYNAIDIPNKECVTNRSINPLKKANQVGISSLRMGNVYGEHSVFYAFEDEIIEIKHSALSKKVFAIGAVKLATKIINKKNKLYTIDELLGE